MTDVVGLYLNPPGDRLLDEHAPDLLVGEPGRRRRRVREVSGAYPSAEVDGHPGPEAEQLTVSKARSPSPWFRRR
jgi:hypothetical protein